MNSKQKALFIAGIAKAKKAEDIVILDVKEISNITDFFIIATASSIRRAQAIVDDAKQSLRKEKESVSSIEGYQDSEWMLIDAYDVVMHVFNGDARSFYDLEGLWSEAPKVRLCQNKRKKVLNQPSKIK